MRNSIKRIWLVAATLLVPALALANEGETHAEHAWDTTALVASVVNFVVLVAVLVYLGRAKLNAFLKERRAAVESALQEAARLKAEAEAMHREYTERLGKLDQELALIKSDMREAGIKERDRIVAEAEHKAARMRREAEFIIEQRVKELRSELSHEVTLNAVSAAEQLLRKAVTAQDQQRLAAELLNSLPQAASQARVKRQSEVHPELRSEVHP
jgi:F-type H+-transporting ATPase subunit b